MNFEIPDISNEEKADIWQSYHERDPIRVPVSISTNPRIILLNPELNTKGYNFKQVFNDPKVMFKASLDHEFHRRTVINTYCDSPTGLPDEWTASVSWQNVYEAAFFGAEINFREGQVPDTEPFLSDENRDQVFETDIDNPLSNGIFKKGLEFHKAMCETAENYEFHDKPVKIARYEQAGSDGALTVSMNIRGQNIMTDLVLDPDYANKLLGFITEAAIKRAYAFREYWNDDTIMPWFADDSVQLISTDLYREMVMPHHKRFYEEFYPGEPRGIHLCGDVQRHLSVFSEELNVKSFDTRFPIDFTGLRQDLGPDVEIQGGVPVALLLQGTPEDVYKEACRILNTGIKEGGRFILRDANNLPPSVPAQNLAAMYKASLDEGTF